MFRLELCDDDSHIVDCDSIVLCCATVHILQSRSEKVYVYILMVS